MTPVPMVMEKILSSESHGISKDPSTIVLHPFNSHLCHFSGITHVDTSSVTITIVLSPDVNNIVTSGLWSLKKEFNKAFNYTSSVT